MDASGQLQREAVERLFQRFDTDRDGFVDTGQLLHRTEHRTQPHS